MATVFARPSALQERSGGKVRCLVCERRCRLVEGGVGWCRTRTNRCGTLLTLTYGAVSCLAANPIEKKPFYHFYPGSRALTAGSWGCNFGCPWCQNWDISRGAPASDGPFVSPEDFVEEARRRACQGTSISFNEPTLSLEWSLEVFPLARARGLYNTYVTNGYMTAEALDRLAEAGLDAMNVDLKGNARALWKHGRGVHGDLVWARCLQARRLGLHLEVTSLLVPGVNDDDATLRETVSRIAGELGPSTPWHVSAYYPAHRFAAAPTPVATLERAWERGREHGLEFVYIGNVPGHPHDNTSCPGCGALLVERCGFTLTRYELRDGRCPHCHRAIAGIGWGWAGSHGRASPARILE